MAKWSSISISFGQKSLPADVSTSCVTIAAAIAPSGQNQMNGNLSKPLALEFKFHEVLHDLFNARVQRPPGKGPLVVITESESLQVSAHRHRQIRPDRVIDSSRDRSKKGMISLRRLRLHILFAADCLNRFRRIKGKSADTAVDLNVARGVRQIVYHLRCRTECRAPGETYRAPIPKLKETRLLG